LLSSQNLMFVWGLMAAFQFTASGMTLLLARETSGRNLEVAANIA
jgi:hypothetical protein